MFKENCSRTPRKRDGEGMDGELKRGERLMLDGRRLVKWHLAIASSEGVWGQKHQMSKLRTSNIFKLALSKCKGFPKIKWTGAIFTICWRSNEAILEQSGQTKSSTCHHHMHADWNLLSSRSAGLRSLLLVQS